MMYNCIFPFEVADIYAWVYVKGLAIMTPTSDFNIID